MRIEGVQNRRAQDSAASVQLPLRAISDPVRTDPSFPQKPVVPALVQPAGFSVGAVGRRLKERGAARLDRTRPPSRTPAQVTELTGISDQMVARHRIDPDAVGAFVADANVVIAHNADFDRKLAERLWPVFKKKHWACSAKAIDCRSHSSSGAKLAYLLAESGYFHGAHRAIDDCHALLEILARPLPGASATELGVLLSPAWEIPLRVHDSPVLFRFWAGEEPMDLIG